MIYENIDLFQPEQFFNECHAAYIIEMPNHSLWVSFFAGTREKAMDVGSWYVKKPILANNSEWSDPKLFLKIKNRSHGGGHFFVNPEKTEIWMYMNVMNLTGRLAGWSTCNTHRWIYRNHRWDKHDYIRRMIGWNTRGKVLVMDNGNYLFPMHDELLGYKAYFLISKDQGKHWKSYGPVKTPKGCLEPTVVQLENGDLLCYLRTKEREIFQSISKDRGKTWSKAVTTGLPNPDSMVELLVLPDGIVVLAYNHSKKGRSPLNLRYSKDNTRTWSEKITIVEGDRELSYPCMVYGSDNLIHLVYTNNRKTISYVKFDEEWLLNNYF